MLKYLEVTAKAAGFGEPKDLVEIIGAIIGAFLSLLGIIFIVLIIYGGFLWMTSAGNENQVARARLTIQRAIVGVIIIICSYAITAFVFNAVSGNLQ